MKLSKCVQCGSANIIETTSTIEFIIDNKTLCIPNVSYEKCIQCNEIYHTPEASKYIDKQIAIFKAEGFENRSKEVVKSKGITQEELGNLIGVTKQRINQIFKDDNLDVKTMYKIANAIDEPVQNVFSFNRITQKDSKFYIDNE